MASSPSSSCAPLVVVGATVLGARARTQAEIDAQLAAKGLANAGVSSVLVSEDLDGAIDEDVAAELLDRLQRGVLADGTAFRIRVWSPSGDLLFTTDAADEPDAVSTNLETVYAATNGTGRVASIRTSDGEVFSTFVPLRLGQDRALGAVEVDQGYERIGLRASSPWSLLRTIGVVGAALALVLVVVASLPGAGSRTGGFVTPGRAAASARRRGGRGGPAAEAEERARIAEERAKESEERARAAMDRERDADSRATRAEAGLEIANEELDRLRSRAPETVADPETERRLREASRELDGVREELRLARADAARVAEPDPASAIRIEELEREIASRSEQASQTRLLLAEAEQRATDSQRRVAEAEAKAAEAERRLAEAVADAQPHPPSMSATDHDVLEARARTAEAERRAAEAEMRVAEAAGRVADAEGRAVEAAARAAEATSLAEELSASLDEARTGAARASVLEDQLATARGDLADANERADVSSRRAEEATRRHEEAERGTRRLRRPRSRPPGHRGRGTPGGRGAGHLAGRSPRVLGHGACRDGRTRAGRGS